MSNNYNLPPCPENMPRQVPAGMQAPYMAGGLVPTYPLPVISPQGYPTGLPLGPAVNPPPLPAAGQLAGPQIPPAAVPPSGEYVPQTVISTQYTAGFLKTQIGKRVRVEFLIGTSSLTDRLGVLIGVGASYILLRDVDTNEIIMGDLYSIKFVTISPLPAAPVAKEKGK